MSAMTAKLMSAHYDSTRQALKGGARTNWLGPPFKPG